MNSRESPGFDSTKHRSDVGHGSRCLVVMYHYVHDTEPVTAEGVFSLTTREFKAQLDQLCRVAEPINWPGLFAWMEGRGELPERCFLLTFDDGLADHARIVAPILMERGLHGVFFVPGAVLTSQRMLPAHATHLLLSTLGVERFEHELLHYLAQQQRRGIQADEDAVIDWAARVDEAAAQAMYDYETPARARLKYLLTAVLPIELRNAALAALFERHVGSMQRWAGEWYMGWDDLVYLQSAGHTIGGHGYCHEPYLRLTPGERRKDMRRIAAVLRGGLAAEVRPFSYPYGSFDDDTCAACRETGFAHAFTTQPLWIDSAGETHRLPRVDTIHVGRIIEEEFACHRG